LDPFKLDGSLQCLPFIHCFFPIHNCVCFHPRVNHILNIGASLNAIHGILDLLELKNTWAAPLVLVAMCR
jgi:hypothetical protein